MYGPVYLPQNTCKYKAARNHYFPHRMQCHSLHTSRRRRTGTNTGPRIRTLKPQVFSSCAVSHHQRRSHASDTRPAVRLPTSKTQKERGDARGLHHHRHHSASSEDYIGGDTRARQQATRQHLTGERCAMVKRPLPTNGH